MSESDVCCERKERSDFDFVVEFEEGKKNFDIFINLLSLRSLMYSF